jgi:hypothetical protein
VARLIVAVTKMNEKNQEKAPQMLSQTRGLACYFIGALAACRSSALLRF